MSEPVIQYDNALPEIDGRVPWQRPQSYLVKEPAAQYGWDVAPGRRPSRLLLVEKIRAKVDAWRGQNYSGAADVTRRLLQYWFEDEHTVRGFNAPFRYHFCQREAVETLIWLVEINANRDAVALIKSCGEKYQPQSVLQNISFQTATDGTRQVVRYVEEAEREITRDLPPQDLRRYAFKMATGSGKTWVMAMAVVWSFFHKKFVKDSELSRNFLLVAPNVIVYQRLEKDFANNRIFRDIPLLPPELRGQFSLKVILRGDATEPDASGNLFLTNIHQLYESREREWTPANAVDALLGRKPAADADTAGGRTMLKRVQSLADVVVLNDEAHHVHDDDLEWNKSLLSAHRALPNGLALWLDFSATPKDENGFFPWTVCDYPLVQAVEDRIVKSPLIVTNERDKKLPDSDPENVTKENVAEKYGYWLQAAVHRWKQHRDLYRQLGVKPVLFIMAERSNLADAIGEYLWQTRKFGLKKSEVLVIHTNPAGEVSKKDLDAARTAARDIDSNEIKAIVSVLMLREGWDVRNVTVVLGLRPFNAKARILPEQVIGRGLRLMAGVGPDSTQTLEVLGTRNLLDTLRNQLDAEGISAASTPEPPPLPVKIAVVLEKIQYDIHIPLTKPHLCHAARNLEQLRVDELEAIFDREELAEEFRVTLQLEFQPIGTPVHEDRFSPAESPEKTLATITNAVMKRAGLTFRFAELYPKVREYVETRCFGGKVNLADGKVCSNLANTFIREGIVNYLAKAIGGIMLERRELEFEKANFRLSETKPFTWRRDLPPLQAEKTVFNYVATYNDFERKFAEFLDRAPDVLRFAALGTTEQGASGTQFRVDYLKPTGAIGFYHPDWAVVQKDGKREANWIIETKGRVWEGTREKDAAITKWCEQVRAKTGKVWRYQRVQQEEFESRRSAKLGELLGVK